MKKTLLAAVLVSSLVVPSEGKAFSIADSWNVLSSRDKALTCALGSVFAGLFLYNVICMLRKPLTAEQKAELERMRENIKHNASTNKPTSVEKAFNKQLQQATSSQENAKKAAKQKQQAASSFYSAEAKEQYAVYHDFWN